MYRCDGWTIKEAEHRRTDGFKLRCWRRLLIVPWTAKWSNQSMLKEVNPEYSLERLMLKLEYFGYLMQSANSLEKTLILGKMKTGGEGDDRTWNDCMASLTQWIWVWVSSGKWWRTGNPSVLQSMELQKVGQDWVTEQQQYCDISCLCYTVCSSHSAYAESPPIFPGRSLGLLWEVLGQLRLRSCLTSFVLAPKVHSNP